MPTYTATGALTPQGIIQPDVTLRLGFSYTESTNTVVVIGGTSGTPKTFDNFVTADRAGRGTILKDWTTCTTNMTLTYQVRPVEKRALTIKFILAGTSAGAGDTLDITGTDFDDVAQTESIDVSSGNGIYIGTKKWRTITDIDCTGWSDGKLKVTQDIWGVIWNYGENNWALACKLEIGDGSTSTYFKQTLFVLQGKDGVLAASQYFIKLTANAVLKLGEGDTTDKYGYNGGAFIGKATGKTAYTTASFIYGSGIADACLLYDVGFINTGGQATSTERVYAIDRCEGDLYSCKTNNFFAGILQAGGDVLDVYEYVSANDYQGISNPSVDSTYNYVKLNKCAYVGVVVSGAPSLIANAVLKDVAYILQVNTSFDDPNTCIFLDCELGTINFANWTSASTGDVYDKRTVNITVAKPDGTLFNNEVTVTCTRSDAVQEFSVSTSGGAIAEQNCTYRHWYNDGTLKTDTYTHSFTISAPGYQTLILDNITVSSAIKWHLELQDEVVATTDGSTGVKVIRRPQFLPEPEFIPVPVPMDMGGKYNVPEPNPETMTQREYNTWRDRGGR